MWKNIFKKKEDKIPAEQKQKQNNQVELQNILTEARKIIEISDPDFTTGLHPIFTFIKQFTDYLTSEVALSSYSDNRRSSTEIIMKFEKLLRYNYTFSEDIKNIYLYVQPEEEDIYKRMKNYKLYNGDIEIDLFQSPSILNPWRYKGHKFEKTYIEGITGAILGIETEENHFYSYENGNIHYNLNNVYLYPLGLFYCNGGNHSQYSAKLKGKGITRVRHIINLENLFQKVSFDGNVFSYSSPDCSNTEISDRVEFYIGTLFEIGRIISESNHKIIPENIEKAIIS
ncbi:DUF6710 family protein [Lactococcus garvieae]|uniref:DUF6710 family protein n=1 Tax=Lactococcus garvieae TaxID=1363 RepID=UPI00385306E9